MMSKDFDYAKMVDSEDAAARGMLPGDPGYSEMFPHVKVVHSSASYDELRQQLADVSNERDGLRAFANELVNASYEGGGFDACELQEIAEKHNLVRLIRADESCGEACACTQYGFPADCYRKNQILCVKPTEQKAQS